MSDSSVSHLQQQHQQGNRTCPCKKLPLRLSSFTAAEQGNVHALERFESSIAYRKDAGRSTPLHLYSSLNYSRRIPTGLLRDTSHHSSFYNRRCGRRPNLENERRGPHLLQNVETTPLSRVSLMCIQYSTSIVYSLEV
jgi:hypothetical protein